MEHWLVRLKYRSDRRAALHARDGHMVVINANQMAKHVQHWKDAT
jgi:hypothetical protein